MASASANRSVTLRIVAPHFTAGVDLVDDVVLLTAPILKHMMGWTYQRVVNYCQLKQWTVTEV